MTHSFFDSHPRAHRTSGSQLTFYRGALSMMGMGKYAAESISLAFEGPAMRMKAILVLCYYLQSARDTANVELLYHMTALTAV